MQNKPESSRNLRHKLSLSILNKYERDPIRAHSVVLFTGNSYRSSPVILFLSATKKST